MNKFQSLSLMGLLALLASACGSQSQNPAAYNYGYGVNGQQAAYPAYNNGYNNGWYSQPVALAASVYNRSYQVAAGQQISLGTSLTWGAYIKCDRTIDTVEFSNGGVVPAGAMTVTFNGQAVAASNGIYVAPAAGTLTISADLSALSSSLHCQSGLLMSGNRPYTILQYWVQQQ